MVELALFSFCSYIVKSLNEFIIKAIHENSKISKRELEEIIGLSATAIDNNIDALKEMGLIERVGSAKGGHWKIDYILP